MAWDMLSSHCCDGSGHMEGVILPQSLKILTLGALQDLWLIDLTNSCSGLWPGILQMVFSACWTCSSQKALDTAEERGEGRIKELLSPQLLLYVRPRAFLQPFRQFIGEATDATTMVKPGPSWHSLSFPQRSGH
jgi:hypothetical protein